MRDEIVAGIKNAVDRGSSVEEAAQSFVNAGYNPQEVLEATQFILGGGASNIIYGSNMPSKQEPVQNVKPALLGEVQQNIPVKEIRPLQQTTEMPKSSEKSANKGLIIALIISVLVLVAAGITYLVLVLRG
ncbi:MAG: hypothetical protein Q7S74_01285 [Nanoarchaeota archaeon]|nr:hypothetical protein [Nanoarchaeota archaeon]